MERKLIDYIPPEFQKYEELKAIFNTEQFDFVNFWDNGVQTVMNEQFVTSLDEWGCEKWEKMIGISYLSDDTLDQRRFRILSYLNARLPYTYRQLQNILEGLCGKNGFLTYLFNNEYNLVVKLSLNNERNYNTACSMLRSIVPANLTINVFMFNTHKILHLHPHKELHKYTHYGVRTDVLAV